MKKKLPPQPIAKSLETENSEPLLAWLNIRREASRSDGWGDRAA